MSTKIKLGLATFGYVAVCWHCLHHHAEASPRLAPPRVQSTAPALRRAEPAPPSPTALPVTPVAPARPPAEAAVTTVGPDASSPAQHTLDALTGERTVKFAAGSDQIDPESFALLDAVASALRRSSPECFIELHGHTDNVGNAAVNRDMGARRAAAVARYLAHHGVAYARLRVIGRGAEDPIADNATPEGRERNRRIRFVTLGRCR